MFHGAQQFTSNVCFTVCVNVCVHDVCVRACAQLCVCPCMCVCVCVNACLEIIFLEFAELKQQAETASLLRPG